VNFKFYQMGGEFVKFLHPFVVGFIGIETPKVLLRFFKGFEFFNHLLLCYSVTLLLCYSVTLLL
jgi:hypothetical protein